jgi:hypothetical protein
MITNTGKEIIAKYLIGQAPAYASYLAFGCGAKPLGQTDSHDYPTYAQKDSLDFEMFRTQITSRGYVTENGLSYVVLTADLPTEERYEITEIGTYSAGSNPAANSNNSRVLYAFTENENWEYHTETAAVKLSKYSDPLHTDPAYTISTTDKVFQTNANNLTFSAAQRNLRYEKPRFLNNTILMAGDTSTLINASAVTGVASTGSAVTYTTTETHKLRVGEVITITGVSPSQYNMTNKVITAVGANTITVASTASGSYVSGGSIAFPRLVVKSGNHIHLASNGLNLSKNAPADQIRLAFSVINKVGTSTANPSAVRLILEFSTSDASDSGENARLEVNAVDNSGVYDFDVNRYYIATKELQDLTMTSSFNWSNVSVVKVFVSVLDGTGAPSSDYYVSLDAIRLENLNTVNPLYGLTGYTVVKNSTASTILKDVNTSNVAEFRFALDVS